MEILTSAVVVCKCYQTNYIGNEMKATTFSSNHSLFVESSDSYQLLFLPILHLGPLYLYFRFCTSDFF